jgi:hypothetical protein
MKTCIIAIFLLLNFCSAAFAQGKWELKKNQNGIEVYVRQSATGNLKELRVVCELDANMEQFTHILQDIDNYSQWVYSNKKSVILKTINPQHIVYYTQSHLPWPIKDRDLVIELDITSSADVLNAQAKSVANYVALNNDYVRVPYSLAIWKVTAIPNNKLKVDYTFSVDPGGSIPSWLVNATLTIGPYNSFIKLKKVLKDMNKKTN